MALDTDITMYKPLIDAVTSGKAKVILVADPAKSRLYGHRDWSGKKTRNEMIQNGEFRAYVSFPEKLESSDPRLKLLNKLLSQKYYWNTFETPDEEEGRTAQHYYRIKGDKITRQLPLSAIKHELYKPGVHRSDFFVNLTADHEPPKIPKAKNPKASVAAPAETVITDEVLAEALKAYEVKFTGTSTSLKWYETGVLGGAVSYKLQMHETPNSAASQHIKTLFPRFTDILGALKTQKSVTIANKLQKIGDQQMVVRLGSHEIAQLGTKLPALKPLIDQAEIASYKIPDRAFANGEPLEPGEPLELEFKGGDKKDPQKRMATLFVTQEGDAHYLVVASLCPKREMALSLSRLGLQLPEDWPFTTLDKGGQPTNGHYGKIPIEEDIYDDLVAANIPTIESGKVHETVVKLLADAAVIAASQSEASPKEKVPEAPPKILSPEEIAQRESEIAQKITNVAKQAAQNQRTEEAYLGAINDGKAVKYFAYLLVPTTKGPVRSIQDVFNAINKEYGFKNDDQRRYGAVVKGALYSMLSIPLTEEHYEALRESGAGFSLLERAMRGNKVDDGNHAPIIDDYPAREWLIKKTQEVNAEAQAAHDAKKHSKADEALQLAPSLVKALQHTEGRVCQIRLPDAASIDQQIKTLEETLPALMAWKSTASTIPHAETLLAAYEAAVAMFSKPSQLKNICAEIEQAERHAEDVVSSVTRQIREMKTMKAIVQTYGQTLPAVILRAPAKRYGGEAAWKRIKAASESPGMTEEGKEDYATGSGKEEKDYRRILAVHEVPLKHRKKMNRKAGVMILSPALWEEVKASAETTLKLSDETINDADIKQAVIDHYTQEGHEQVESNPQDISRDLDALGTNAIVVRERRDSEIEVEDIRNGRRRNSKTVRVRDEDRGAQPFVYIAVDAGTRSAAATLLSTLHEHALIAGEKKYDQLHEISRVSDKLLELYEQYLKLRSNLEQEEITRNEFVAQSVALNAIYQEQFITPYADGEWPFPKRFGDFSKEDLVKIEAIASYGPRQIEVYDQHGRSEIPVGEEGPENGFKDSLPDPSGGSYIVRCPLSLEAYNNLKLDEPLRSNRDIDFRAHVIANDGDKHKLDAASKLNASRRTTNQDGILEAFATFSDIDFPELVRDEVLGK